MSDETAGVPVTEDELRGVRMTRHALYAVLILGFVQLVVVLVAIGYANHVGNEANRQWCGIVTTLDDVYTQQPPTMPTGIKIAAEMRRLRADFHC
jgi:hypothetical protein